MPSHITNSQVQDLLERFMRENPNGDTFDLAEYMVKPHTTKVACFLLPQA